MLRCVIASTHLPPRLMISTAILAGVMLSSPALAQSIHKCVAQGSSTTYQSAPCEAGQIEAGRFPLYRPDPANGTPPIPENAPDPAMGDPPRSPPGLPFGQTAIALGMTDDEVLNIPQWGPPTRIERTRARHLFREVWTYQERSAGERQLAFTNGRLTRVDAGLASGQGIHLATTSDP